MKTFEVALGERSYPIWIGAGVSKHESCWRQALTPGRVALVTNDRVGPLYADAIRHTLEVLGHQVVLITLPDGEQFKDWQHLNIIFDGLMQHRMERGETLLALGGGVIGDMAGFAAACYQRGMRFVQIPTTLLAQVDSSVGGKTAINHPLGKNMIGAFFQPAAVLIDTNMLTTLPDRELSAGIAEVIKYGCILDAEFFAWLEDHMDALLQRDVSALMHAIGRSCELKAQVVASDERESGLRAILNFGHTFGHAIEAGLGYGQWLHGEAVGCGMVLAADLSCRLGGISLAQQERITRLIARAKLPTVPPNWPASVYLDWMSHDKKAKSGQVRYVVLRSMGHAETQAVDENLVTEVLEKAIASGAHSVA
ncbi:MAG: 3-dehydroquinate synthase [Burkholderiaceae bacterium]|nr:3-dehydroquinate synthase [Burkholderiaceae bacterium]